MLKLIKKVIMKFFNLFKKKKLEKKPGRFSDFFLNTPEDEKKEFLKEVARKANEDQREMFMKS